MSTWSLRRPHKPFLALRSYLPADHPLKAKEIGSEPTPAAFLDTLLALTAEWRRVLAPHGSICVELGDTYSGSGGGGGDYNVDGWREGQDRPPGSGLVNRGKKRAELGIEAPERRDTSTGWPLAKSLCGIPHLYHLSLAYGRNLLTGEPSPAGQWRIRNVVAWCRQNPPVGQLGDKFRPATSYMTVACVSGRRYFDLDAVRTENPRGDEQPRVGKQSLGREGQGGDWSRGPDSRITQNPAGAPPLDWWEIPTHGYPGSHYATWPPALCRRPIEAMVPHRVCTVCGKPSERIVEAGYVGRDGVEVATFHMREGERRAEGVNQWDEGSTGDRTVHKTSTTLGWTDCGCPGDHWRNGLVLDPFGGSGTTAAVATGCGRDALLIDLDARNAELARERVGMFLEVEDDPAPRPVVDTDPTEHVA